MTVSAEYPAPHVFASFDGARLAYRLLDPATDASGRTVILIHGLFSNGVVNWLRWGTAQYLAAAGFRVIIPDLRGHGDSAAASTPPDCPRDILARDVAALAAHLGLQSYDMCGYSLGARTLVDAWRVGMRPRRVVLAGLGLPLVLDFAERAHFFLDVLARPDEQEQGGAGWRALRFFQNNGGNSATLAPILRAQSAPLLLRDVAALDAPCLVLRGVQDGEARVMHALADALPDATYQEIPGDHMSAVTRPELGAAILAFLAP